MSPHTLEAMDRVARICYWTVGSIGWLLIAAVLLIVVVDAARR